jgi:hypothetical protein
MVSTQRLDIWFVPLFLMGVETIEPVDLANPNAYGATIIHANYTHSLVGALALSLVIGGLAWWRAGGVIVATFHEVCAALRDVAKNPKWKFVREGPAGASLPGLSCSSKAVRRGGR